MLEPASITLDYLELYGLRPAVESIRAAGLTPRVASPRILKPAEQNVIRFLVSLECEILVRSGGLLHDCNVRNDRCQPTDWRFQPQCGQQSVDGGVFGNGTRSCHADVRSQR